MTEDSYSKLVKEGVSISVGASATVYGVTASVGSKTDKSTE